jgi:hypothetical protein
MKITLIVIVLELLFVLPLSAQDITNKLGLGGVFRIKDATTEFFTLRQSNGRVGIGTTDPDAKLTIIATGDGARVLHLGTERGWVFKQLGTGASTALELTGSNPSNNNKNFVINTDGNVGIGTTSPAAGLHVLREPIPPGGTLAMEGSTHTYLSFFPYGIANSRRGYIGYASANARNLTIANENGNGSIILKTGAPFGRVGINVDNPNGSALQLPNHGDHAVGSVLATTYDTYSSRRWKENIHPIPDPLDKVLRLNGVLFNWKPEQGGQPDIGFVAEDVAAVVPELVELEPNGVEARSMKYDRVTALIVEAIKELDDKVTQMDNIRKEIEEFRALIKSLAPEKNRVGNKSIDEVK